jgi:hypothetical protein
VCGVALAHDEETWHFIGDRFSDSTNPRRAIMSDRGRVGYLKVLSENMEPDPWLEQWANEQIASMLARELGIPAVEARAGEVEGELGAIVVFMEGRKLNELHLARFEERPIMEGAANRDQLGLVVAFDVWILNVDRGPHNIFMAVEDGRPSVALIDHGHVLLLPREQKVGPEAPDDWLACVVSDHVNRDELNQSIRQGHLAQYASPQEIAAGARTIAGVSDEMIDSAVLGIDERFFCCHPEAIATLLKHRRDGLGESCGNGS